MAAEVTDLRYRALLAELRAELARRRIRQTTIATKMGLRQQHLSNRLNGHTPFTVPEMFRLADALGMTLAELFSLAPTKNAAPVMIRDGVEVAGAGFEPATSGLRAWIARSRLGLAA